MSAPASAPSLMVRHDSWIRQQVRDLVLHLDAPVESAELLQAALISLARATVHFDWEPVGQPTKTSSVDAAFASFAREQVRADMIDEVRQMTHLSRLQRRRWALLKLAHERVERRLIDQGLRRGPTPEELAVLTGLSVTEVDALQRMARLGPWQPGEGSQHLMELRSLKQATAMQLCQAREDTRAFLQQMAALLGLCPPAHRSALQRHFGVHFEHEGLPLPAAEGPIPLSRWRQLLERVKTAGLDRRPRASQPSRTDLEEVWPLRLQALLQQGLGGQREDSVSTPGLRG